MLSCTCVVPFYNEDDRLLNTIRQLTKVSKLNCIVCVNDGSNSPKTKSVVKQLAATFPTVKYLFHTKNKGKAAAVKTGLDTCTTDWVFLLDADLQQINPAEIGRAVQLVAQRQNQLDVLILRRAPYNNWVKTIRHDILMSGERILRTNDLKLVYKQKPFSGYQLEVAINHYMLKHRKRAFWLQTSLTNTYKINKWGLKSLQKYYDELTGYMSYEGFGAYIKQITSFCKQPIK